MFPFDIYVNLQVKIIKACVKIIIICSYDPQSINKLSRDYVTSVYIFCMVKGKLVFISLIYNSINRFCFVKVMELNGTCNYIRTELQFWDVLLLFS